MGPNFDPAVAEVLEAFGRRLASGSMEALPAEELLKGATSLVHDSPRAREILRQLVSEGLLEERGSGGSEASATYSLTRLGWARIEQRKRKEED